MVHNGIEYAEMQHLSEATMVLRRGLGHSVEEIADLFDLWNAGELESFLVEITAKILRTPDPQRPGEPLLDAVLDRAGQKGTGRWTVQAALDLNVATPSIAAAVDARVLSSQLDLRVRAGKVFDGAGRAALEGVAPDDVRAALFASRIAAYSQGFALLAAASRELDYGTDLAEIARIWKAGCIIRARLLEDARRILAGGGDALLALEPDFRTALQERLPAWRNVLGAAARAGLPVPGLSSSLGWFETLTTERGSASLIQAQRDYFGAHRYERVDAPGKLVHTDWEELLGKRD
jgi:6-phosphogluconate dehydrogenase